MEMIQKFMNDTIRDLRRGQESWRVILIVVLYAITVVVVEVAVSSVFGA